LKGPCLPFPHKETNRANPGAQRFGELPFAENRIRRSGRQSYLPLALVLPTPSPLGDDFRYYGASDLIAPASCFDSDSQSVPYAVLRI